MAISSVFAHSSVTRRPPASYNAEEPLRVKVRLDLLVGGDDPINIPHLPVIAEYEPVRENSARPKGHDNQNDKGDPNEASILGGLPNLFTYRLVQPPRRQGFRIKLKSLIEQLAGLFQTARLLALTRAFVQLAGVLEPALKLDDAGICFGLVYHQRGSFPVQVQGRTGPTCRQSFGSLRAKPFRGGYGLVNLGQTLIQSPHPRVGCLDVPKLLAGGVELPLLNQFGC